MNLVDRFVSYFDPQKGLLRARNRYAIDNLRRFEAASKGTSRTKNWKASPGSANKEYQESITTLRDRSRQLRRDNPIAKRLIEVMTYNVIGHGIIPQIESEGLDKKLAKWADSTDIDADGKHDFYGLQAVVMDAIQESGDVIVRRVWLSKSRRKKSLVPFKVQILEADYLDHEKNISWESGEYVIQGVHYRKNGEVKGYWLFSQHPYELYLHQGIKRSYESTFVPAEDVLLPFDKRRPGQVRGIPSLAPIMLPIKDLNDAIDAELVRIKTTACFAGFITDPSGDISEDDEEEIEIPTDLVPGSLEILKAGQDVKLTSPPQAIGFTDFVKQHLHMISAGYGTTYEALTNDLKDTNFSSGRMGRLEFQRTIDHWRYHVMIPQFCRPVVMWFLEAMLMGSPKKPEDQKVIFTPPKKEFIDPDKETRAIKEQIRIGVKPRPEAIREMGYDPKDVYDQYEKDNKEVDKRKLIFDSDPRRMTGAGNVVTDNSN